MGEYMLMVMPSPLVAIGRKLKLQAETLEQLVELARADLELSGDADISLAVEGDAAPARLRTLAELPNKAKVQFWPKVAREESSEEEFSEEEQEPETTAADEVPAAAARQLLLMVTANDVVTNPKKLQVEAQTLEELAERVAEGLELHEPVFVCEQAESIEDAVPYGSLDEIGDKAKVSVWPTRRFEEEEEEQEEAEQPASGGEAVEEDEVDEAEEEAVPPLSAEAVAALATAPSVAREVLLMVAANDAVPNTKKLKLEAQTLEQLAEQVAESLEISEPVFVCPVAESIEDAVPYGSLEEIGEKAKVSVWPTRRFDELSGTEPSEGQPPERIAEEAPEERHVGFAADTDGGSGKTLPHARSYAAGEYKGLLATVDLDDEDAPEEQAGQAADEEVAAEEEAAEAEELDVARKFILMVVANDVVKPAR